MVHVFLVNSTRKKKLTKTMKNEQNMLETDSSKEKQQQHKQKKKTR